MVPGSRDIKDRSVFAHGGRGLAGGCAGGAGRAAAKQPLRGWFPRQVAQVLAAPCVLSLHVTCSRIPAYSLALSFFIADSRAHGLSAT